MSGISVVVPTHDRLRVVARCVAALVGQSASPETFEIVVVCDGCTDGTARALRAAHSSPPGAARPRVTVLEQERSGAATARNRGVEASSGELLVFLDDDMIARPDLVEAHRSCHARYPGSLVVGAIPVHPESPPGFLTDVLGRWTEARHRQLSATPVGIPPGEVLTGHLSVARADFAALGGFDVRFTAGGAFGGEDVEFGWRARQRGMPIRYEGAAIAHQFYVKTFRALCANIRHAGAADVRLASLHPEMRGSLLLGALHGLRPTERSVHRATLLAPRITAQAFAPVVATLDAAGRRGLRGRWAERLQGLCRAHFYALGVIDARRE